MTDRTGRILVVDDHPTNRMKMSMAVQKLGHEADQAEDGIQALESLASEHFDLVLLDIVMPEMDGYQVLEKMKDDFELQAIPVIVISSVDEMASVVKAIELGAEDYLPKNFDPVLLKARVGACLEKKQLRDQEIEYLKQVALLTDAATKLESEDYDPMQLDLQNVMERQDELGNLSRVFKRMAVEIHAREQHLRDQVRELQIRIDKVSKKDQVTRITGTDYFNDLKSRANDLRGMLEKASG